MSISENLNSQVNPQLLQQRLTVREQEINALKVQNRHLLGKLDELENKLEVQAKPNQINTQFVADEVQKYLEPLMAQMQSTMNASFEILQSTMRGIYQQSTRAQTAVEEMTSHSKDLEMRMDEQRKADQNYYQDKIFSMIGTFCDRTERQIDMRLKALSVIEVMNSKQNEVLNDVESIKASLSLIQKNTEASRGEVSRMERNASEINEKIVDVQVQTQNTEELIRDTLQQVQNHRAEFKLIRAELKATLDYVGRLSNQFEDQMIKTALAATEVPPSVAAVDVSGTIPTQFNENRVIIELIENKQRELETLERNLESQNEEEMNDDAAVIISLLREQKAELQRVADEAKSFLKAQPPTRVPDLNL